jgi:3-phenylpropionate/trans-cinnamate dioxygenase ferredoxin reductase subunit
VTDFADGVVIAGASLAGLRAAETLRERGYDGRLVIVGAEPHPPYDRPPLSKQVLTGKADAASVALTVPATLDAEWLLGSRATSLDILRRRLTVEGHGDLPYSGLIIATGARPKVLPFLPPGPGVHYLRTLDDALALRADLEQGGPVAIIGAGFIGLEVASSAAAVGAAAVVLEALPVPLERALGPEVGRAVLEWHLGHGTSLRTGVSIAGVDTDPATGRPRAVTLAGAPPVEAAAVVVGVGVAPDTGWLETSGLDLADGVLCDSALRALSGGNPVPGVVAAGDAARWWHPGEGEAVRVEHWTNAVEAGAAAAATILGDAAPYAPVPYFWSDQLGVKIQAVGRPLPGDRALVVEGSFAEDRVLVAYGRAGRTVAALGIRRPARVMALQRMIADGIPFPPPPAS